MKKFYFSVVALLVATLSFGQISMVQDINPGTGSSSPANLFVSGDYMYFAADDAKAAVDHGKELWRTDGVTTEFIKDLRAGTGNGTPGNFFSLSNTVYFSAHNGSSSVLHSTDGTETGTVDLGLNYGLFFPKEYNGKIYAVKTVENNAMYEFDGTTAQRVANSSAIVENVVGGIFTILNGKAILYMKNNSEDKDNIQGTEVGAELYEYDFTTHEYTLIKNISADVLYPAEGEEVDINGSGISNMVNVGTKVYFEAESVLWETDGTTDGTIAVAAAASIGSVSNFYAWDNKLFFEGDNGTDGDELYVYDPSANTVTMLSSIDGSNVNHDPSDYCAYNGYLYYAGKDDNDTKKHLYRTNGTTIELLDAVIIDVDEIVELNGVLYFEAEDASGTETTGNELFKLDPLTLDVAGDTYAANLSVYPNPTEGTINVAGLESVDVEYVVFDISGRAVQAGIVTGQSIELNVKAGIYMLQLVDNGTKTVHKIKVK